MHELVPVLQDAADAETARVLARYFQVRPGGYGEGDVFLGIKLSRLRALARPYYRAEFRAGDWLGLLQSPVHEHRLICLVVMAERAGRLERAGQWDAAEFAHLHQTYLAHTAQVDNWDLVDVSCAPLVGGYVLHHDRGVLDRLVRSPIVWDRRIAMVSTHRLIRAGESRDAYRLAELLLDDPHDLIHKAVGWMLREAGRRVDPDELRRFLTEHATRLPRTTLRYAVEHFDAGERRHFLRLGRG